MSIMGFEDGFEDVEGDDEDDMEGYDVVGARPLARRPAKRGGVMRLPRKPAWRSRMAAPGVPIPGQGLEPLPLTADLAGGIFATATPAIAFQARPQRPFRAERLLASVVLTGDAAGIVVCDGIYVGTSLQTVELGSFDVSFFAPTAFGVRLSLIPAAPGILIRLPCRFVGTIGTGTAVVSLLFLGRTIG